MLLSLLWGGCCLVTTPPITGTAGLLVLTAPSTSGDDLSTAAVVRVAAVGGAGEVCWDKRGSAWL